MTPMTLAERRQERDRIFGELIGMLSVSYDFYFRSRTNPSQTIMNPAGGDEKFWNFYERRGVARIDEYTTIELTRDHRADAIGVRCLHRIGDTEAYEIADMTLDNTSALFASEVIRMFIRQVR